MALKLGINLGYWGIGPQGPDALEAVRAAESRGFDSVWVAESYGSDCVSVLAWLAAQTDQIKLGAAIMQVPARPPAAASRSIRAATSSSLPTSEVASTSSSGIAL